jgi:DNA-binding response OmpR family regulator
MTSDSSDKTSHMLRPVLLVDGDIDSRLICRSSLARSGIEVIVVSDGDNGVDVARIVQPKVVILNVEAGRDGLELISRLRIEANLFDVTMIALTDESMSDRGGALADGGFDHVLLKPINPNGVLAAVQKALSELPEYAGRHAVEP